MTNPALAVAAWAAANPLPTGTVPRGRVKKNESTTIPRVYGFRPDGGVCHLSIQLPEIHHSKRLYICISDSPIRCGMDKGRRRQKCSN